MKQTIFLFGIFFYSLTWAAGVAKVNVISNSQSLGVGQCSSPVIVQAQTSTGSGTTVRSNTKIFFTGSSSSLSFYKDSTCSIPVDNLVMPAKSSEAIFYFKSSLPGSQKIIVATLSYIDGFQIETISQSAAIDTPQSRTIPSPIYGVTLDKVGDDVLSQEISAFRLFTHFPTARIVFDPGETASYYAPQIAKLHPYTYILGQISDSTGMSTYSIDSFRSRTQSYWQGLGNQVDVWEIGNEVNGGWLGTQVMEKIQAASEVITAQKGKTAITFFWEGEAADPNNCMDGPRNDLFSWISDHFQLTVSPALRNPDLEKIRLSLSYALISWYPKSCPNMAAPHWPAIYTQLSSIFPNAQVGFGELGTASPEFGSAYELALINQYYPLSKSTVFPSSYIGGYFWWNFAEEISQLLAPINSAIK